MITCAKDGVEMVASSVHYIEECCELRVWMICPLCGSGIVIGYKTDPNTEFLMHRTED